MEGVRARIRTQFLIAVFNATNTTMFSARVRRSATRVSGVISGAGVGARQVQRTSEQPRMAIPLATPGACNENPVPCKTINLAVKCSGMSRLAGLTDG
jgi:hypothetical protein